MELPLHETLRRLRAHAGERDLDPKALAAKTALSEDDVRALLRGESLPKRFTNDRVRERISRFTESYMSSRGKRLADLVSELHERLGISTKWARLILTGERVPSVELLHDLVDFFGIEGGESFFTAEPADALHRVLHPALQRYENPSTDPVQALMDKYGVVGTDLRRHGSMNAEQLEQLLKGVIQSVMPVKGDTEQ